MVFSADGGKVFALDRKGVFSVFDFTKGIPGEDPDVIKCKIISLINKEEVRMYFSINTEHFSRYKTGNGEFLKCRVNCANTPRKKATHKPHTQIVSADKQNEMPLTTN